MKKFDLKELCVFAFALKKYNLRSDLFILVVTYVSPSSEQTSSLTI